LSNARTAIGGLLGRGNAIRSGDAGSSRISQGLTQSRTAPTNTIANATIAINELRVLFVDDSGSGIFKANASEFLDPPISSSDYGSSYFELRFFINQGDTAPTFKIELWDNVGNPTVISLTTVVDNGVPSLPVLINIIERSRKSVW